MNKNENDWKRQTRSFQMKSLLSGSFCIIVEIMNIVFFLIVCHFTVNSYLTLERIHKENVIYCRLLTRNMLKPLDIMTHLISLHFHKKKKNWEKLLSLEISSFNLSESTAGKLIRKVFGLLAKAWRFIWMTKRNKEKKLNKPKVHQ